MKIKIDIKGVIILIIGIIILFFLVRNIIGTGKESYKVCHDEKYDDWIYFIDREFPPECVLIDEDNITWRSEWSEVINDSCIEDNKDYKILCYHCVWGGPAWMGLVMRIGGIVITLAFIFIVFAIDKKELNKVEED